MTSERASKGQGGEYLDIEILGHNKLAIARIKVTSGYPYEYNMDVYPVVYPYPDKRCQSSCLKLDVKGHGYRLKRIESKGEKEKKASVYCTYCGYVEAQSGPNCKKCGKACTGKIETREQRRAPCLDCEKPCNHSTGLVEIETKGEKQKGDDTCKRCKQIVCPPWCN